MIRRLLALAVLLVVTAGVCPLSALDHGDGHGCCAAGADRCASLGVAMTCCTPPPTETTGPTTSSGSTAVKLVPLDRDGVVEPLAWDPAPAALAPFATHGISPLSPLLSSCLRRV